MPTVLPIDPLRYSTATPAVLRAAWADRAFPLAQELLAAPVIREAPGPLETTWHDVGLDPLRGAFAFVQEARADLVALLGTTLRLTVGPRSVFVYVIGSALIDGDVSLARRAYLALAPWNVDPILALAEVVHER